MGATMAAKSWCLIIAGVWRAGLLAAQLPAADEAFRRGRLAERPGGGWGPAGRRGREGGTRRGRPQGRAGGRRRGAGGGAGACGARRAAGGAGGRRGGGGGGRAAGGPERWER